MVIRLSHPSPRRRGMLNIELLVALSIAAIALIPLAFSYDREHRLLLDAYHQAVAMEVIDGEMEILVAGEWKAFQPGAQPYAVHAAAAKNLPQGRFTLTLQDRLIRLEWKPDQRGHGGRVVREVTLP